MRLIFILLFLLFLNSSCSTLDKTNMAPPKPKKVAKKMTIHGDTRVDHYYWMKERTNPEVLKHLKAENAYAKSKLKHTEKLKDELFTEMKGREKKEDSSVPVLLNGYYYSQKYKEKSEYPIIVRQKNSLKSKDEVVLDANKVAKGKSFFSLGGWSVTSNSKILAYATDTVGRRLYTIHFKDLSTGKNLKTTVKNVTGGFVWAEDNKTLFYSKQHPKTLRHEWIYAVDITTGQSRLVYHEKDEKFYTGVGKTRSRNYIYIRTSSTESSEYWLIDSKQPTQKPRLFNKRRPNHEYSINHAGKFFFILSNKGAKNFKVFRTPDEQNTDQKSWKTYLAHRSSVFITGLDVFSNHLVLEIRKQGVSEIEIMNRRSGNRSIMAQPEKSHHVGTSSNPNYNTDFLRYYYTSLTTPVSIIDINFKTNTKTVRKVKEVLGGFNQDNYTSERIYGKAKDGTQIPISLVYKKGLKKDGTNPLYLYGYGSYGYSINPSFSSTRLSLIDRGFIFAIAHIRGSSTMGRQWYLDGKYLKKKNTFSDFIAAADHLVAKKYTSANHLYAAGGSAGGLLMGAVINMRPELFNGVIAQVPFVDVVTTMLDESLPLTTNEYEEWGNPNKKKYYNYMKSYSPYDNIKKQSYPHLLVTSGFHDSQVQYWEPTKWVAKLRDHNTGNKPILLDTNLEAGHGGKSGRFKRLEDTARNYAFILDLED